MGGVSLVCALGRWLFVVFAGVDFVSYRVWYVCWVLGDLVCCLFSGFGFASCRFLCVGFWGLNLLSYVFRFLFFVLSFGGFVLGFFFYGVLFDVVGYVGCSLRGL